MRAGLLERVAGGPTRLDGDVFSGHRLMRLSSTPCTGADCTGSGEMLQADGSNDDGPTRDTSELCFRVEAAGAELNHTRPRHPQGQLSGRRSRGWRRCGMRVRAALLTSPQVTGTISTTLMTTHPATGRAARRRGARPRGMRGASRCGSSAHSPAAFSQPGPDERFELLSRIGVSGRDRGDGEVGGL
ncbi:hypothetical protein OV203_28040 [Nannocystis sp. ILAH1]|uniref:hypothetical protein n=1 Tax=Nannocystis sp. ILAH1 TaxID=2996789 RepID=UPI0022702B58|nr:hypothetical protein [Nannocystis sp. ILAH1]MCY0991028.1 hypothetical protein [Nannocystis sp. ILAH1]